MAPITARSAPQVRRVERAPAADLLHVFRRFFRKHIDDVKPATSSA